MKRTYNAEFFDGKCPYTGKSCYEWECNSCEVDAQEKKDMEELDKADKAESDDTNTNKSDKEMLVEAGTKPIGLTREMLGIDQAVVAGRNKQRSIEDVKQYIAKELEAAYQHGYDDGWEQCKYANKLNKPEGITDARHNVIRDCLRDIIKTLDSDKTELAEVLSEL